MKKTSLIKIISLLLCLLMVTSSVSIISVGAANNTTCKTHTYDKGKVTTKATCKKTGVKTYTCTVCGKTKTESIKKVGHEYVAKTTKKATCKSEGVKTYACKYCGKVQKTEKIKKTGHTYNLVASKKATTKENGKVSQKKCSVCGKTVKMKTTTVYKIKSVTLSKTKYTYNGKVQKPSVKVTDSKGKTVDKKYYTLKYSDSKSTKAGSYTVTVTFKGIYSGSKKLTYKIANPTVKLSKTSYTYNGKVQKPTVTVTNAAGKVMKEGTDYTVKYSNSKSTNSGTYSVTVTYKGNYSGKKTLTYKIVDDQSVSTEIAISSLKNKTKEVTYKKTAKGYTELNHKFTTAKRTISEGVTVKWNKVAGVDGYQVQYSLRSDFSTKKKYNLKTVKDAWDEYIVVPVQATYSKTVSGGDKTSVLINGTVAEKYYFRVRTYKTVDGAKVYSSWSAVKSIKALYSCAEILNGGKASNGLVGDYRFNQKFENAKLVYGGNKYHVCTSLKDHYEIACNELYECKYCSDGYHCKGNYIYNTVLDEFGHKNNFGVKCPEYNEEDKKQDEYDASHCDRCGKEIGYGKGRCIGLITGYKTSCTCLTCGKTIKNPDYASCVCHECYPTQEAMDALGIDPKDVKH